MVTTKREYGDLDEISKDEWDQYYDKIDKIKNLIYGSIKHFEPTATYEEHGQIAFGISVLGISFDVTPEI